MKKLISKTLVMGTLAGMRAVSAPALLSRTLSDEKNSALSHTPLRFLQNKYVANTLTALAASEIIGDKIPNVPDRIEMPSLLTRMASGALVGAALFMSNRQNGVQGAAIGAAAALAGTYASFYLRKALRDNTSISDPVYGALEDALVMGSGYQAGKM